MPRQLLIPLLQALSPCPDSVAAARCDSRAAQVRWGDPGKQMWSQEWHFQSTRLCLRAHRGSLEVSTGVVHPPWSRQAFLSWKEGSPHPIAQCVHAWQDRPRLKSWGCCDLSVQPEDGYNGKRGSARAAPVTATMISGEDNHRAINTAVLWPFILGQEQLDTQGQPEPGCWVSRTSLSPFLQGRGWCCVSLPCHPFSLCPWYSVSPRDIRLRVLSPEPYTGKMTPFSHCRRIPFASWHSFGAVLCWWHREPLLHSEHVRNGFELCSLWNFTWNPYDFCTKPHGETSQPHCSWLSPGQELPLALFSMHGNIGINAAKAWIKTTSSSPGAQPHLMETERISVQHFGCFTEITEKYRSVLLYSSASSSGSGGVFFPLGSGLSQNGVIFAEVPGRGLRSGCPKGLQCGGPGCAHVLQGWPWGAPCVRSLWL